MRLVLVVLVAVACAACATLKPMSAPFGTCMKADLGQQIPSAGLGLLEDLSKLIDKNAASLESDLAGLVVTVGVDAFDCALAAYQATHGGAATPATADKMTGLTRALAWRRLYKAAR